MSSGGAGGSLSPPPHLVTQPLARIRDPHRGLWMVVMLAVCVRVCGDQVFGVGA
jgi:hypothetical protein